MQTCLNGNRRRVRPTLALALVLFPLSAAGEAVRQVTVDPEIIRIEVADGNDLRFSSLTRAQGVSQTQGFEDRSRQTRFYLVRYRVRTEPI